MNNEVAYVLKGGTLSTTKIGKLELPTGCAEAKRCEDIKRILKDYADRTGSPNPLSIAVFGPPGSGKSRCVREIAKTLGDNYAKLKEVNLSQFSEPDSVVGQIKDEFVSALASQASADNTGATKPQSDTPPKNTRPIPIIFFDEFDTPLNGNALGWLRWFLAPMQDGKFVSKGGTIETGKAVFIFAGGTAASFEEFEERAKLDEASYREKKVPDFISRLRSFIDIKGVNERDKKEKEVRRALALRHFLLERWTKEADANRKQTEFNIEQGTVESLLSNVHFIHGARSMEALVEMSTREDGNIEIQIPNNELTAIHVGRGALDGKLIGISAGLEADKSGELLSQITAALLREGAKLAYGGDFQPNGTLHRIIEAAEAAPADFFNRNDKRIRNYLGFPSFLREEVVAAKDKYANAIEFHELMTLFDQEINDLNLKKDVWFSARPRPATDETYQSNHHLAWAISLFRMRVRLIQDIDALIVFGGKDGNSWGRFSGVAEEVMLAIALQKPVYILGGLRGAAREVGKLLGLDHTMANPDECLEDEKPIKDICPPKFKSAFSMPNLDLPSTVEEMRTYLFSHPITDNDKWPWNGLNPQENRDLFRADILHTENATRSKVTAVESTRAKCVDAIIKGLGRLDWQRPAAQSK